MIKILSKWCLDGVQHVTPQDVNYPNVFIYTVTKYLNACFYQI